MGYRPHTDTYTPPWSPIGHRAPFPPLRRIREYAKGTAALRRRGAEGHTMENGSTGTGTLARRVEDLVHAVCGVRPRVVVGLASETETDGQLRVPPTWIARMRTVRELAPRAVVDVEGEDRPLVILDAHAMDPAKLRPTERAWRVVAVRRSITQDLEVLAGVLRWAHPRGAQRGAWRIARSLPDARRRPSAATVPTAWTCRPMAAPPSTIQPSTWTVVEVCPSNEPGHQSIPATKPACLAKYATQPAVETEGKG